MNTHSNIDIPYLINAFAYPFGLLNETFYLRKRDMKIIDVHMVDMMLFEEDGEEEDRDMPEEQKKDIKEAILANEKGTDSHVKIPRISFDQRFEIMQEFMEEQDKYADEMAFNLLNLNKAVKQGFGLKSKKKGMTPGIQMEYLTYKIDDEDFEAKWVEFYRGKVEVIALKWLGSLEALKAV